AELSARSVVESLAGATQEWTKGRSPANRASSSPGAGGDDGNFSLLPFSPLHRQSPGENRAYEKQWYDVGVRAVRLPRPSSHPRTTCYRVAPSAAAPCRPERAYLPLYRRA